MSRHGSIPCATVLGQQVAVPSLLRPLLQGLQKVQQNSVKLPRTVKRRQMSGFFDDCETRAVNKIRNLAAYRRREQPVELTADDKTGRLDVAQPLGAFESLKTTRDIGEGGARDLAVDALPARQECLAGGAGAVAFVKHLRPDDLHP